LLDFRVKAIGNDGVGAAGGEAGGEGGGEGDEAGIGVSGVDELGGLGDVLSGDQARLELVIEVEAGERGDGGAAVGGAVRVGDGEAAEIGVAQQVEGGRRKVGVFACPEDEGAAGVKGGRRRVSQAGFDEAAGVAEVGGEKEVKGGAVLDLSSQHGGGLEGGFSADAGGLAELVEDGGQNRFEVGGCGDAERGLGGQRGEAQDAEEGEKNFAGQGVCCLLRGRNLAYADRLAPLAGPAAGCFGSGVLW